MRFFQVATLNLDDSFAHFWHSFNQRHEECFSNSLEGVPTYDEHMLAAFPSLCGPTHPKPSQLGWGRVFVEARSSEAAFHHSPWSNSSYTACRCVLGHCPVEKQIIVPLSPNQMGWSIAAACWLSVPWILNKSQTVSPAKHPHTITPPPPCFTVGTTHVEIIRSPTLHLTKTKWLEPKISNLDSSDKRTDFHRSNVHYPCFLTQASVFLLLVSFSSGFFAAIQPWKPESRSLLLKVDVEMCLLLEAGNC